MRGTAVGIICLVTAIGTSATSAQQGGVDVLDIGSRLELLVDDWLIAEMTGVELRLQHPVPREVVMVFDQPWEGNASTYPSVFQDGDLFRMYYRGDNWDFNAREQTHIVTCAATSQDGIHWDRPTLRIRKFNGSDENNIVWEGAHGSEDWIAFRDENPAAPETERFKAVAGLEGYGFMGFSSGDGFQWKTVTEGPLLPDRVGTDWIHSGFWDPVRKHYRAYLRHWIGPYGSGVRSIRTCTSEDFTNWTEPVPIQYDVAPTLEVQLYTNAIQPYFRAPHILIGFPKRFTPVRKKMPKHPYEGLSDGGLLTSRDALHFRNWQEAFIRPGLDQQNWVQRNVMPAVGIVQTSPEELSLYWVEHYHQEIPCQLRRGTLRTDGFASVNAPYVGGEFTTKPLTFEGKELVLNYSTSAVGNVQVEVQKADGTPVEGFTLKQCPELFGDEIEHIVSWEGGSDLSSLAGQPVRLRFVMKDADLYSLRFR